MHLNPPNQLTNTYYSFVNSAFSYFGYDYIYFASWHDYFIFVVPFRFIFN